MAFLFAYLHFIGFIALVSLLVGELILLRKEINTESLIALKRMDLAYGLTAGLVLVSGITRIFYEKGWSYYAHSTVFWVKIALFLSVAILSLYPTVIFIRSKNSENIGTVTYLRVRKIIHVQLMIIPFIVFCALWMARGIY
ncbi:MAG: DUF2214 family protein [Alphaproteobacteria bacterium]